MTVTVTAVYEDGVLKLAEGVPFDEGEQVEVTIRTNGVPAGQSSPAEILGKIAAMPIEGAGDEHAARDHDRYLYGDGS